MSTTLDYNGVTFYGCQTVEYSQRAIYDASQTDVLRHETRITVKGIAHKSTGEQYIYPASGAQVQQQGGAAILHDLRESLMCPRKRLLYRVAGVTVLDVGGPDVAGGAEKDVDNGPHPESFQVLHIAHDVIKVQFTISCTHVSCCGNGADLPDVLNNRWSVTESRDDKFRATRTVRGRLRVSSIKFNPQAYRALVMPRLEPGWKVVGLDFTTDPSGMEMDYSIVYTQQHAAPPPPAIDWDCSHTASSSMGGITKSHFHITLEGPPNVERIQLIAAAVQAAEARVGKITEIQNSAGNIIRSITVSDVLSEPRITLEVEVDHVGNAGKTAAGLKDTFGQHLPTHDPKRIISPQVNPKSLAGVFSMFLQDPCEGPFGPSSGSGSSSQGGITGVSYTPPTLPGGTPASGGYDTVAMTTFSQATLTPWQPSTSDEMKRNIYTFYRIEQSYHTRGRRIALPVALHVDSNGQVAKNADEIKLIEIGPGMTHRIVTVHAERSGAWPKMPKPEDYSGNAGGNQNRSSAASIPSYILDATQTLESPELLPDGVTSIYRASFVYVFVLKRALKASDSIAAGASPAFRGKAKDNFFAITANTNSEIIG